MQGSSRNPLTGLGDPWERVHWEYPLDGSNRPFRADIYAVGDGRLPSFWFECRTTQEEKLHELIGQMPGVRIVHVLHDETFLSWWNADTDSNVRESKEAVITAREEAVPGVEYWAVRMTSTSARFIFAVRRELDGKFTYLDTGEGRNLFASIRFISRRHDQFRALISGIAGKDDWCGENTFDLKVRRASTGAGT